MVPVDPLSDLLYAVEARSVVSTGLNASLRWAVRVEGHSGLKFNAVTRGTCQLRVDGLEEVTLREGDCFLLTRGLPFLIASDLALPPRRAGEVFGKANGFYADLTNGADIDFSCLGGRMDVAPHAGFVMLGLPPLVVLRAGSPEGHSIRWLLERLVSELSQALPGSHAISTQIMHLIFMEMMRTVSSGPDAGRGWLGAVFDRNIGKALGAIHANPHRNWRLVELAAEAGLSRSQFSARFLDALKLPPMEYLVRWRMALAAKALNDTGRRVSQIAEEAGYRSEAAFGAAFKRIHGVSPGVYRDRKREYDGNWP